MNILLAGLPAGIASPLADRFRGAVVQLAFTGDEAVTSLEAGGWRLLVIDDSIPGLPAGEVLRWARTEPALAQLRTIYCVDLGNRSEGRDAELEQILSRLAPDRILLHPLDRGELVRQAALLLDESPREATISPAAPARALEDVVARVWERSRPAVAARVESLRDAALAAERGSLLGRERHAAEREAHKLAGALGTFGYAAGSELAREIERVLASGRRLSSADGAALGDRVERLREVLARAPARAAAPDPEPAPAAAVGSGTGGGRPLLLVVDDDRELAALLASAGARERLEVSWARTPAEGREQLRGRVPSAVLLDLSFPDGEDGFALLAELGAAHPEVPVLVSTSRSTTFDRVRALHHGARGFLRKPFDAALAMRMVARHAGGPDPLSGASILAVDDDPVMLATLEALLVPQGARVHTLHNPLRFWSSFEEAAPELVVLDADMPHLDGIEVCRVLRSDLHHGSVPVLFLTARTDADAIHRMFAAGADDYVPKSAPAAELVGRIRNRLRRARAAPG